MTSQDIGGLAAELLLPLGHGFEPHVAEAAMYSLLATAGASVKLRRKTGWQFFSAVPPTMRGIL